MSQPRAFTHNKPLRLATAKTALNGEMSASDIGCLVSQEVTKLLPGMSCYVSDLYTDVAVVSVYAFPAIGPSIDELWVVPYTLSGEAVTLGQRTEWQKVERTVTYKPVAQGKESRLSRIVSKAVRRALRPAVQPALAVAKEAWDDLVFVASGAYRDNDDEHVGKEFLSQLADQVNSGETLMTVDFFHVGFPSRNNPSPTEAPILLGGVLDATFVNDHLALRPYFPDPVMKEMVQGEDFGLSIWFNGAQRDAERVFKGKPGEFASVAVLPRGFESYPYTKIFGG